MGLASFLKKLLFPFFYYHETVNKPVPVTFIVQGNKKALTIKCSSRFFIS